MERLLGRLGRGSARHPWRTIGGWIAIAFILIALAKATGGAFINDFRFPGTEAQVAADITQDHFPRYGATSAEVVFVATSGTITEKKNIVDDALVGMRSQPGVSMVEEPVVSPDQKAAISTIRYHTEAGDLGKQPFQRLEQAAKPARAAGLMVEFRGMAVEAGNEPDTGVAEFVGLAAALIVLLIAFGSVIAAGLPIAIAVMGLLVGTSIILLIGIVVDIPTTAPIIAVMLGMGAGIDYALFVVTRFRQALLSDGPSHTGDQSFSDKRERVIAAAGIATATAGHAVLFAGGTVVVAILGLWFAGVPFIAAMGLAGAVTVMVMVVAAVTLLPALLGLIGYRINSFRLRIPNRLRQLVPGRPGQPELKAKQGAGGWARWGAHTARFRWPYMVGSVLVLLVLACPILGLRLGVPDDGSQPTAMTQRRAYDLVSEHYGPGWNGPLIVTVKGGADDDLIRLSEELSSDDEVSVATPAVWSQDHTVALITVIPQHGPQDQEVTSLTHRIRDDITPRALAGSGAQAYIGGLTAISIDASEATGRRLPWIITGVVLAGALLLIAMFRAPLVAVKAAFATMLSIGVAYGVLVAVFQWGWAIELVGIDKPVPIMSFVPMLLFAILFGLSMDYEVFLLSAIRESARSGMDPRQAVAQGLGSTGRVITAAAVIMACVFVSFVSLDDVIVKMLGLGLATAVIVDATIIRVVFVPSIMAILGRAAWWPRIGTR